MAKKYNIKYTPRFMSQLHEILFHIRFELKNDIAAENLANDIIKAIEKRSNSPESFQVYKKYSKQIIYYRINVKSYSIFYEVENNTMIVVAIYYSKKNLVDIL